ncbi:MAG: hypothetical protein GY903_22580 [Fuerstiella sp.]|nr:hypothetical protein [Fuerstiella sp.]MCP4857279.1 hypothetical protein [Fuerstiella sp.]
MNHQLLAGAADDQTAADAYIEDDFHGAFTFYLCDASRSHPDGTYDRVMDTTIAEIASRGFHQIPQNEGPFGDEKMFGGDSVVRIGDSQAPDSPAKESLSFIASDLPAAADCPGSVALLNRFLRVSEKILDLSDPALTVESHSNVVKPDDRTDRSGTETIVYVHGISQHRAGFSNAWFAAVSPYLQRSLRKSEVVWSQHVNPRNLSRADTMKPSDVRAAEAFRAAVEAEMRERRQRTEDGQSRAGSRGLFDGSGLSIDDFVRYMFVESSRQAIIAEFDRVVRPLLAAGTTLHIVSHSWGTVVAYEALRRMDSDLLPGRVENLFTVGAALSIGAVQSNLFGRVTSDRRPDHVRRVINLSAGGDPVGGAIGDEFNTYREFLGLEPTGCRTIPFTNIAFNPVCAHSSYFVRSNLEVSRDIFARYIN